MYVILAFFVVVDAIIEMGTIDSCLLCVDTTGSSLDLETFFYAWIIQPMSKEKLWKTFRKSGKQIQNIKKWQGDPDFSKML